MESQFFIIRTLTKFDGYGAPIGLTLHGEGDVKSFIGAMISILMIVLSLVFSLSTFMDYVNETNPSVSTAIQYGTPNLTFDYDNFFFAISFYQPKDNIDGVRSPSNTTNNYTSLEYINQLNVTCTTCNAAYNPTTLMNLCAESMFTDMPIKSFSKKKATDITDIFSYYSFCLPQNMTGVIEDVQDNTSNLDSTLQVMIPVSNVSIAEVSNVKQNTVSSANLQTKVQASATSTSSSTTSTTSTATASNPFKHNSANGGHVVVPSKSNTSGGGSSTSSGGTTTSGGGVVIPGSNTGTTSTTGTQTGTTPTTGSITGSTTGSITGTGSTTTTTSLNTNPLRILSSSHKSPSLRDLSTVTLSGSNLAFYNDLISIFNSNLYPKMLILHRSVQINTGNSANITNFIYNLEVLDYKDSITGNPIVYDVYVQKYSVIIDKGSLLSFTSSSSNNTIDFLVVESIQKNTFDSLTNDGAYLTFKLYSDTNQITIQYVTLTDFLGTFGSFYSILSLIASILSSIYNGFFLKRDMINSIFRFIDNDPDPIAKYNKKQQVKDVKDFYMNGKGEKEAEADKLLIGSGSNTPSERSFKLYGLEARKVGAGVQINAVPEGKDGEERKDGNPHLEIGSPSVSVRSPFQQFEKNEKPLLIEMHSLSEASVKNEQENKINQLEAEEIDVAPAKKNSEFSVIHKLFQLKDSSEKGKFYTSPLKKIHEDIEAEKEQHIQERDYYRQIYYDLRRKKKEKHRVFPSIMDFICMQWGCKRCKNGKKKRYDILEKCGDIIDSSIEINNIVKRMFEIEFLKKLILTDRQEHLLKFQYRYLNLNNYNETMKFLNIFETSEEAKLDKHLFDNIDVEEKIDVKEMNGQLLDGLKNYYNY